MKYRVLIPACLFAIFVSACSATGPVRFYQGPPKPTDQVGVVIVPAALNVRSIDGRAVNSPSKDSGTYQLQLLPGHHLIAFRYEMSWGDNTISRMIRSDEVGVDTVFNAGTTYKLEYKVPHSMEEAYDVARHFSATLVNDQTGEKYASFDIENLNAALIARGIIKTKNQVPLAQNNAATHTHAEAANMTSMADKAVNQDPVKRLKFWWLMANKKQRKEFSDWMKGASESFAPSPDNSQQDVAPDTINGVKIKP